MIALPPSSRSVYTAAPGVHGVCDWDKPQDNNAITYFSGIPTDTYSCCILGD